MKISTTLTISLLVVALSIGYVTGYYFSPSYQSTMYNKQQMGLGAADRFVDLRYLDQMAAHHRAAILLADQAASTSKRAEIQALAREIQTNEPKLIATLMQWKKDWYNDSRPVPEPTVAQLGAFDDKSDLRFLNALIAHHDAGIAMTQEIRSKSSRTEVLNDADSVEAFLTSTLIQLKAWRSDWYSV